MKKCKFLILLICSLILAVFCYCTFFIQDNNELKTDEDVYNDDFFFKEFDEKNITYNKNDNLIVKNQLIIETDETSKKDIEKTIKNFDGEIVGYIAITHTYQIEFNNSIDLNYIIKKMKENKHIHHISYNYVLSLSNQKIKYPNDKVWEKEWSEVPDGDNWGLEATHIPETWNYLANKKLNEINIGVLECNGFQEEHKDLKNNINSVLGNYNQKDKDHGTEVTGIIAAEYNNKLGISGVTMNKAKIDYFSYMGSKNSKYTDFMSYQIGLTYLITKAKEKNNQTAIVNASLGYGDLLAYASFGSKDAENEIKEINEHIGAFLKTLLDNGYEFLIVKAAGNSNENEYIKVDYDENNKDITKYGFIPYLRDKTNEDYDKYSSYYPNDENELMNRLVQGNCDAQYDVFSGIEDEEIKNRIIVVGATENGGNNKFKLSEWYSVCGSRVDILAPGTDIETTTSENRYKNNIHGTSFSAPYVSGIAGLVLTIDKSIPGDELKQILIQSGQEEYKTYITRHDDRSKDFCNYSMIDAFEAVKLVENKQKNSNVDSVKFEKNITEMEGINFETAVISGIDQKNKTVWTYKSKSYECTELDRISEIGLNNNIYYFIEDGAVIALNKSNGKVLWKNNEFGGSTNVYAFDKKNNLYLCGFYGPDLFAVNEKGETLHKISQFDSKYIFPSQIKYDSNKLYITFENSILGNEAIIIVNLEDYTYSFEEKGFLSDEKLNEIKKQLNVPNDLQVTIDQNGPYYWDTGNLWYLQISIKYNGQKIAGVDVDASSGEWIKEIQMYDEY